MSCIDGDAGVAIRRLYGWIYRKMCVHQGSRRDSSLRRVHVYNRHKHIMKKYLLYFIYKNNLAHGRVGEKINGRTLSYGYTEHL